MKTIFFEDLVEIADIGRQVLYIYGSVFDHRHGLVIARKVTEQAETGFAQGPDLSGILAEEEREEVTQPRGAHVRFHAAGKFPDLFPFRSLEFYDEDGARVALDKESVLPLFDVVLCAFEDITVDQFHRGRSMTERQQVGPQ